MTQAGRCLEDLAVGESAQSGWSRVDREEMLEYARRYDPQYFHADPEAAKSSVFGEVIASGLFTAALWRRLDHAISGDIAWICGVAWQDVRWPVALRAGDEVRARWECVGLRPSASDPGRGVVEMRYTLENRRGEAVFTCLSINLIETLAGRAQRSARLEA
jgi:acyl dehydratase